MSSNQEGGNVPVKQWALVKEAFSMQMRGGGKGKREGEGQVAGREGLEAFSIVEGDSRAVVCNPLPA